MMEPDMKKDNKIKKIIAIVALVIVAVLGVTYAFYYYMNVTSNKQLITGDIYLDLDEDDEIKISEVMPIEELIGDNYIEFTVLGTNESEKDIIYDINVIHGSDSSTSGAIRIEDKFLSFTLKKEVSNGVWDTVVDKQSYVNFATAQRIYVDEVGAGETVSQKYRLYVWINDDIRIYDGELTSNDGDYSSAELNRLFASVKIRVTGDFNAKTLGTNFYQLLFDKNDANHTKGVSDTTIVFSNPSGGDGKTGLYYMNSTASDKYPIYYYRGNVTTNNIVFAGFCWKIVRTTDTGGIKVIYNGVYDETDKCVHTSNTSSTTGIGATSFNDSYKSLAHMGYSYAGTITTKNGTTRAPYELVENDTTLLDRTTVLYAGDIEYNNETGKYKLKGETIAGGPDSNHHYSLNSADANATDSKVRFYYYANKTTSDAKNYYIELTGGDNIDDAVRSMTENPVSTPSTIQSAINSWYNNNLSGYENNLEDTVWCMDRSRKGLDGWNSGGGITTYYYTRTYDRASNSWATAPKLTCDNENDQLQYKKGNIGSKAALLTYDEVGMAGMRWNSSTTRSDNYLYTGYWYWLLSPAGFFGNNGYANAGIVHEPGGLYYTLVNNTSGGVRPVVSLEHGTLVYNYDAENETLGTEADPYIVGNPID